MADGARHRRCRHRHAVLVLVHRDDRIRLRRRSKLSGTYRRQRDQKARVAAAPGWRGGYWRRYRHDAGRLDVSGKAIPNRKPLPARSALGSARAQLSPKLLKKRLGRICAEGRRPTRHGPRASVVDDEGCTTPVLQRGKLSRGQGVGAAPPLEIDPGPSTNSPWPSAALAPLSLLRDWLREAPA